MGKVHLRNLGLSCLSPLIFLSVRKWVNVFIFCPCSPELLLMFQPIETQTGSCLFVFWISILLNASALCFTACWTAAELLRGEWMWLWSWCCWFMDTLFTFSCRLWYKRLYYLMTVHCPIWNGFCHRHPSMTATPYLPFGGLSTQITCSTSPVQHSCKRLVRGWQNGGKCWWRWCCMAGWTTTEVTLLVWAQLTCPSSQRMRSGQNKHKTHKKVLGVDSYCRV